VTLKTISTWVLAVIVVESLAGCGPSGSKVTGCAAERPSDANLAAALTTERGDQVQIVAVAADCATDGTRTVEYKEFVLGNWQDREATLFRADSGKWFVDRTVEVQP
jgi:hypothetical protein